MSLESDESLHTFMAALFMIVPDAESSPLCVDHSAPHPGEEQEEIPREP